MTHGKDMPFIGEGSAEVVFDGSVTTRWYFMRMHNYPWVAWTFPNGNREIATMYDVATAADDPVHHPKHWIVYGSNDGVSWHLLDERDDVTWDHIYETKRFTIANPAEYNSYIFELRERSGADPRRDGFQLSEWTLLRGSVLPTTAPTPAPTPTPEPWFPIYDPLIFGDNCYYEVQETCLDDIIPDMDVVKKYLAVRDAFPLKALKHTRVIALSGMTVPAIELIHNSLKKQTMNSNPIDMYFYSDYKITHTINATMAVPLISLAEFTRPSRIVFGDGSFKREGMAAVIEWMVDNRDKGYFVNLELLQITGHRAAAYDGSEEEGLAIQNQIVANLKKMCTDKENFPKLNTLNFNNNAYNEFNGFDDALYSACSQTETGVTILTSQVTVTYPSMCSTTRQDNYEYYDMTNQNETAQCRFTWNWEVGDTINVYAPAGPFPNERTESCDEPGDHSIYLFQYPSPSYSICLNESFALFPDVRGRVNSYSVVSGSLPSGLVLSEIAGIISGVPNTEGVREVSVKAQNAYTSRTTALTLSVVSHLNGSIYTNANQTVYLNQPINPIIPESPCSGCTYSALDALPVGVTLNPITGHISGAPTEVTDKCEFAIQRSNSCNSHTDRVILIVIGYPSISYSSSYALAWREPVNIRPTMTNVESLSIVSGSLPPGLSWNSQTGAIMGSPTTLVKSSVIFRALNRGSSTNTTVVFEVLRRITQFSYEEYIYTLAEGSSISLSPIITGSCNDFSLIGGGFPYHLELNTTTGVISGVLFQSVSDWHTTIKARNALGEMTSALVFNVLLPITSFSYPQSSYTITTGVPFSATPVVDGDVSSYSLVSDWLPADLQLNTLTGVISGRASVSILNKTVRVKAMNALGYKTTTFILNIYTPISHFSYTQTRLCLAKGEPFYIVPIIMGSFVTYSITSGSLPTGTSIDSTKGVISGIPSAPTFTYQPIVVTAVNEIGSRNCSLEILVLTNLTSFSYPQKEYAFAVNTYATVLPVVDSETVEYSLQGSLPTGIGFEEQNGGFYVFAAVPIKRQVFTVVASNELGSLSCVVAFRILNKITQFSYPQVLYTLVKGKQYVLTPFFDGDEVSFSVYHGSLPQGLTLDIHNGTIEGVPLDFFSKSVVTIQAKNDVCSFERTITLMVLPLSLPLLLLISAFVLLVLVILCCCCWRKVLSSKRKERRKLRVVRMDIPDPGQLEGVPPMIEMQRLDVVAQPDEENHPNGDRVYYNPNGDRIYYNPNGIVDHPNGNPVEYNPNGNVVDHPNGNPVEYNPNGNIVDHPNGNPVEYNPNGIIVDHPNGNPVDYYPN